jgi:hypothetical protein
VLCVGQLKESWNDKGRIGSANYFKRDVGKRAIESRV